jgi:aldehyde dehydrogenase (NAD+)
MQSVISPTTTSLATRLRQLLDGQKAHHPALRQTTARQRQEKLKRLREWILAHRQDIRDAVYSDFRKPAAEVDTTEITPTTQEIKYAIKHLPGWMRPKRMATPLPLFGSRSEVHFEPKGIALIIAPWNYPFHLVVSPLVSAIAAGCCAIVKPSELTPHTSALVRRMVGELFPEEEVAVTEGNSEVAKALLELPFDHIFFTGSPAIGKVVMKAAAEHLTSVTLELGGKSPAVVDETANVREATEKLSWGKFINGGQTCIAPDYVLVHASKERAFLEAMRDTLDRFYPKTADKSYKDLARVVNSRHFLRVRGLIEDAVQKGARVAYGGHTDETQNLIAPTLLTGVNGGMNVMQEEIFGPVLPVLTYRTPDEAVALINSQPKPLALYAFGQDTDQVNILLSQTTSGGVCVNDTLVHIANPDLPFGGVNNSGIGKSHGHYGFLAFSNEKAVLYQNKRLNMLRQIYPPYSAKVQKMIDRLVAWFA